MANKLTYPIYLTQESRTETKWLKLTKKKGFEIKTCNDESKINNSIRVFTGKEEIELWRMQMELIKNGLKVGRTKVCREIDFMCAYQEVKGQAFPGRGY